MIPNWGVIPAISINIISTTKILQTLIDDVRDREGGENGAIRVRLGGRGSATEEPLPRRERSLSCFQSLLTNLENMQIIVITHLQF